MDLLLGEVGRVLVLCAGLTLILLTLLCVVCSVAPSCWIYRCLHRDSPSLLLKSEEARRQALQGSEVVLAEFPHVRPVPMLHEPRGSSAPRLVHPGPLRHSWRPVGGVVAEQGTVGPELRASASSFASSAYHSQSGGSSRSSAGSATTSQRDSAHSTISETSEREESVGGSAGGSTPLGAPHPPGHPHVRPDEGAGECTSPPQAALVLQLAGGADSENVRLYVTLKSASHLPPRQYGGAADAFLRVRLTKPPPGAPLLEMRSRTVRRSANPEFDETFQVDMRRSDLKDAALEVTAFDQDRYANPSELTQGRLALAAMLDLITSMASQQVNLSMQASNKALGEVMLSVTHLPTAQRVSLSVTKAKNLRMEGGPINPYIRVFLLSSLGRSVKRKKTTFKVNSASPSFTETLSFDVASGQLEGLTFLVTAWHRADLRAPSSDEGEPGRNASQDVCLGKVCLGGHVRGTAQRLHWRSVLQNPRKVVTHWHPLH